MLKSSYKQRYAICIYNRIVNKGDNDDLIALCETVEEFAELTGKSLKQSYDILGKKFKNKDGENKIFFKGRFCELAFVDLID